MSELFQVVYQHLAGQLLFFVWVTSILGQIVFAEPVDSRRLFTKEFFNYENIDRIEKFNEAWVYALRLELCVNDVAWATYVKYLARMEVLVHMDSNLVCLVQTTVAHSLAWVFHPSSCSDRFFPWDLSLRGRLCLKMRLRRQLNTCHHRWLRPSYAEVLMCFALPFRQNLYGTIYISVVIIHNNLFSSGFRHWQQRIGSLFQCIYSRLFVFSCRLWCIPDMFWIFFQSPFQFIFIEGNFDLRNNFCDLVQLIYKTFTFLELHQLGLCLILRLDNHWSVAHFRQSWVKTHVAVLILLFSF